MSSHIHPFSRSLNSSAVFASLLIILQFLIISDDPAASKQGDMFEKLGESIEFAGMAVSKLAMDPNKLSKSGKILLTGDLAQEYNFEDLDGSTHDIRSISVLLKAMGWNWTSWFIPSFIRIPHFVMHFGSNKF